MTTLEPLTHPDAFHLTPAQSTRLDAMPDGSIVVGVDGFGPIVRPPSGRLMVIPPDGNPRRAGALARASVEDRQIDLCFPREHG